MDDLVNKVIELLKKRQASEATVSFNAKVSPPDEQIFINNSRVVLKSVSIDFITDLYSLNQANLWVRWLLKGIDYDVKFFLRINSQMINFVPRMMILDWPIIFFVGEQSPLIASRNQVITRNEIAALPDNSILVRYYKQIVTDEANDICRYKNITIMVRTEKNCIWLKS